MRKNFFGDLMIFGVGVALVGISWLGFKLGIPAGLGISGGGIALLALFLWIRQDIKDMRKNEQKEV